MEKLNINEWAPEDRPREKLLAKGPQALSEAELLAILIGSGSTSESAVDLMRRILGDRGNSLKALGRMTLSELVAYKGVGEGKAVTIMAACELGRRRQKSATPERHRMDSAAAIYEYYAGLRDKGTEEFHLLMLNNACEVIAEKCMSQGGLTQSVVDIRLVMREALIAQATAIAVCHNHPSGRCQPSNEDKRLTQMLDQAAQTLCIRLLDHVIVTDGDYYSFHDEGLL